MEKLTIPKEVRSEQDFDDVLTVELKYGHEVNPQASAVAGVLLNITKLYEAVAVASGYREFTPLTVVYITSGTGFRFDFKGLGEPIKHVKSIFVDAWFNIRHRKADDFQRNGKAVLEGLNILKQIQSHSKTNALNPEDANRLSQQITKSMLELFEAGALLREVPDVENVSNKSLMQGMQQKLLPPAPEAQQKRKVSRKEASTSNKDFSKASRKNFSKWSVMICSEY